MINADAGQVISPKVLTGTLQAHRRGSIVVFAGVGYSLALIAYLVYALPVYSTTQRILGWCIFVLGSATLFRFVQRPHGVPLIECVLLQYVILFSLPLFYQEDLSTFAQGRRLPSEAAITTAQVAALLALASIRLGYGFAARTLRVRIGALSFPTSTVRLFAYGVITSAGGICLSASPTLVAASWAQPTLIILSQDLGFALLGLLYYRRQLKRWQSGLALALLVISVAIGIIGGMTQTALQPLVIWMLCKWMATRKSPRLIAVVIGLAFFLSQPVKGAYRVAVWYGSQQYTMQEKATLYGQLVLEHWGAVLNGSGVVSGEMKSSAAERLSLLLSTAHYVELTPQPYDYANGATFAYVAYAWIPRFLWRNKPIAQLANKTLPVRYGIQSSASAERTVFGVGHVAETFVNFGLLGIVPVFLVLGVLYYMPIVLIKNTNGTAGLAVILAASINMIWIESTVSHVFGGVCQQIIVQTILLRAFTSIESMPMAGRPAVASHFGPHANTGS